MSTDLNDWVLGLVRDCGLRAVVEALAVACDCQASIAADSEEATGTPEAWETDARTVRTIVPLVINEDAGV
jgi:hypothetical protein